MIFKDISIKTAYLISLFVIILDQVTKYFFKNTSFAVENTGAAFGILKESTGFLVIVSFVVVFLIVKCFKYYPFALSLILGGTIGNLVDRVSLGYVIDFINVGFWPVFNIADSANTIGFILLVWLLIKENRL